VATEIVERLADEIAAFAIAAIRRTSTTRFDVEVVLAGGLTRARYPRLLAGVEARVREVAPRARIVVLDRPPVVGAALIGLDRHAPSGRPSVVVEARLRSALTEERMGLRISIDLADGHPGRHGDDRRHGERTVATASRTVATAIRTGVRNTSDVVDLTCPRIGSSFAAHANLTSRM
jgi:hypothetical protein